MRFHGRPVQVLAVLLAVLGIAGSFALLGPVAAADVTVHESTYTVENDSDQLWVEAENLNANDSASLDATVTGLDANGNETGQLDTFSMTVDPGNTTMVNSSATLNASEISQVNVQVVLDNTTVTESDVSISSGVFTETAGGGGGFDPGGLSTVELAIIALLIGGGAMLLEDS